MPPRPPFCSLADVLDRTAEDFAADDCEGAFARVVPALEAVRRGSFSPTEWRKLAAGLSHPTIDLFRQEPLTARCLARPRGYAGDAVMIDHLYSPPADPRTVAERLTATHANSGAGLAVRHRRDLLASRITALAAAEPGARVLSVACGHFREYALVPESARARLGEVWAVDQDAESLAVVENQTGGCNVRTIRASIVDWVREPPPLEPFDLVYAAGLFDYFLQPTARRIAAALWAAVKPGGVLLVPNFHPDTAYRGFMEAVMDWWLVYRTEAELTDLLAQVPPGEIAEVTVTPDPTGSVRYLEASKR